MLIENKKILVHFNKKDTTVFLLRNNTLNMLKKEYITFEEKSVTNVLLEKIDRFLEKLEEYTDTVSNENVRVCATGLFQHFNQEDQTRLVIHVFVNHGLYFNIVQPDLEQFYLEQGRSLNKTDNVMESLIQQEFRKVVVCGSFQQHLQEIEDVITVLHKHNITVLSPWTTKIVPETIGTDFILLEGQEELRNERDTWKHKYEHMDKFRQSDAIIICNPGGLIGQGTMFEFGFMAAISKRVIFTEQPKDLSILFPYEIGLNF